MSEEQKKVTCPNCLGPAVKEGKDIVCETCDATFAFTKTGGAKVKELGRLEALEKRVDHHDDILQGQEPDPAALEPDPAELEPDPAENEPDPGDQESNILGPE